MAAFAHLPTALRSRLLGQPAQGTPGILHDFASVLTRMSGRRFRERLLKPEVVVALYGCLVKAWDAAFIAWRVDDADAEGAATHLHDWLLSPAALSEFRKLIVPGPEGTLDVSALRDEFDAAGLDANYLGQGSFDRLLRALIVTFYQEALRDESLRLVLDLNGLSRLAAQVASAIAKHPDATPLQALEDGVLTSAKMEEVLSALIRANAQDTSEKLRAFQQASSLLSRSGVDLETGWSGGLDDQLESSLGWILRLRSELEAAIRRALPNAAALLEKQYRDSVSIRYLHPPVLGLLGEELTLAHLYVMPQVRNYPKNEQQGATPAAVEHSAALGAVVIGEPGVGKTTLLYYLLTRAAKDPQALLPVYFPLAAYEWLPSADSQDAKLEDKITQYAEKQLQLPGLRELLDISLQRGQVLLLLDGLDHLDHEEGLQRELLQFLERMRALHNRVILTARRHSYWEQPLPDPIRVFELVGFSLDMARRFFERCYQGREGGTLAAHQLFREVTMRLGASSLLQNPLFLSLLISLADGRGNVDAERVQVYGRFVDRMLARWKGAETQSLLIALALWLHRYHPDGTVARQDILLFLEERGLTREEAQQALRSLSDASGLLADRGNGQYGFIHLAIQEYLVGRALAHMTTTERWEAVASEVHHPRWREPLLLCAEYLTVVMLRRHEADELAHRIHSIGSDYEDILHRDLFLALDVAISARLGVPDLSAALMLLIQQEVPDFVQEEAWRYVARMARGGDSGAIALLRTALKKPDWTEQALLALSKHPVPALTQCLMEEFPEWGASPQSNAVTALAAQAASSPRVRDFLLGWLDEPNLLLKPTIVYALAPLSESDPEIRSRLLADLRSDGSRGVLACALIAALAPLLPHDQEVVGVVLAILDSDEMFSRQAALDALAAHFDEPKIRSAILARLRKGPAHLRLPLRIVFEEDVQDILLQQAETMEEGASRWMALSQLGDLSPAVSTSRRVRDALLAQLKGSDGQATALHALAPWAAEDEEIRAAVDAFRNATKPDLRLASLVALAPIDETACCELRAHLNSSSWNDVISAMVRAVGPLALIDTEMHAAVRALLDVRPIDVLAVLSGSLASDSALQEKAREAYFVSPFPGWGMGTLLPSLAVVDAAVREDLLRQLSSKDEHMRRTAVFGLSNLVKTDVQVRNALVNQLNDEAYSVRLFTIRGFASLIDDAKIQKSLKKQLNNTDGLTACAAIVILAPRLEKEQLVSFPWFQNLDETIPGIREAWVEALTRSRFAEQFVPAFLALAQEDDAELVRSAAIYALARFINQPVVRDTVEAALSDGAWEVRAAAAWALSPLMSTEPALRIRLLPWLGLTDHREDIAQRVRLRIANLMSPLLQQDQDLYNALRHSLQSPAWPLRQGAAWALSGMKVIPPELLPELRALLHDDRGEESWAHRLLAAEALIAVRKPGDLDVVSQTLQDAMSYGLAPQYGEGTGASVRAKAAALLALLPLELVEGSALPLLAQATKEDPDPDVRKASYVALLGLLAEGRPRLAPEEPHHWLTALSVRGFKAIRAAALIPIQPFTVLVGRNGSGKSTLMEALHWLDRTLRQDARSACEPYNGIHDLLFQPANERAFQVSLAWDFRRPGVRQYLRYELAVQEDPERRPAILKEGLALGSQIWLKTTAAGERRLYPEHPSLRDEQKDPLRLGLAKGGRRRDNLTQDPFDFMQDFWSRAVFLRLSPSTLRRRSETLRGSGAPLLEEDGEGLPALLSKLSTAQQEELLRMLQLLLPQVEAIDLSERDTPLEDSAYYMLTERRGGHSLRFPAWMLSEGTRRLTAILALLVHQPPVSLLCIEEVENGLDPWTVIKLLELLQSAVARGTQVIVTTHSPWLLDHVPIVSILQVHREEDGEARYERFGDREQVRRYMAKVPPGTILVNELE